jgi:cold shock CspA family protein
MPLSTIRKLIHLCNGTDIATTHLITSHNGVGYGYIAGPDGDLYFDNQALQNRRFDQLQEGMAVEYIVDDRFRRASSVTVTKAESRAERSAPIILPRVLPGGDTFEPMASPLDVVEESLLESFPASDAPAHSSAFAPQ